MKMSMWHFIRIEENALRVRQRFVPRNDVEFSNSPSSPSPPTDLHLKRREIFQFPVISESSNRFVPKTTWNFPKFPVIPKSSNRFAPKTTWISPKFQTLHSLAGRFASSSKTRSNNGVLKVILMKGYSYVSISLF